MGITEIALFKWKKDVSKEVISELEQRLTNLQIECLNTSGQQYVTKIRTGPNILPSPIDGETDFILAIDFQNKSDLDYYLKADPVHLKFIEDAAPSISKVTTVAVEF